MCKYKYLLFDADDTIFDFLRAEKTALKLALEDLQIPFKEEYVPIYSAINLSLWKALERKEITKPVLTLERFRQFFEKVGIPNDPALMKPAYQQRLGEQCFLLPGSYELLEKLSKDYEIYIITNGLKLTQSSRFARSGLNPFIKGVFISEEVGYEKPDLRYFETVMAGIPGFEKEKALVIGDSLTSDILGGNNAGIQTVWFNAKNKENDTIARPDYVIHDINEIYDILK